MICCDVSGVYVIESIIIKDGSRRSRLNLLTLIRRFLFFSNATVKTVQGRATGS